MSGSQYIYLNGEDVSRKIRSQDMSDMASRVATMPKVREKLVDMQREIAKNNGIVMDGRDIGTFVLPNADFKFYIDASVDVRAERRMLQLQEKGLNPDYYQIREETEERDYRDRNRRVSPLVRADDAFYIDTSAMSREEVVETIMSKIKEGC